jgi:polysaccharide biosynthesis/export protein
MGDYVAEPPDMLVVEVLEALPGRPISGERLVRPDGTISLGFYGDVYVAGLTIPEVKAKVIRHMQKYLSDELLGLIQHDEESGDPILDPVTKEPKLSDPKDSDRVFVDVTAYNSKFYYIQGQVLLPDKLPITGRETILDAINYAGGMLPQADHKGVVLYRQPSKGGPLEVLPIDIDQITMGDDLSTNYQILPGDRLVIPRDPSAKPEATEHTAERAQHVVEQPRRPSLSIDRHARDNDTPAEKAPTGREKQVDNGASLRRVEARLNKLEQKLDLILEALKQRKP